MLKKYINIFNCSSSKLNKKFQKSERNLSFLRIKKINLSNKFLFCRHHQSKKNTKKKQKNKEFIFCMSVYLSLLSSSLACIVILGSAEAINFPRLNVSPTRMMRTYTPEPRGFRGRRELPREPWRQVTDPRLLRRDPLSFEQAFALGRHQNSHTIPNQVSN